MLPRARSRLGSEWRIGQLPERVGKNRLIGRILKAAPAAMIWKSSGHSGAAQRAEPGTYAHRPLENGFRVHRCAVLRNDGLEWARSDSDAEIEHHGNLHGNVAADSLQIAQSTTCDSIYDCGQPEPQMRQGRDGRHRRRKGNACRFPVKTGGRGGCATRGANTCER
jgi:hypothetical protein